MEPAGSNKLVRNSLQQCLDRYGHRVYAVIADRAIRCRCFDEATHESDPACQECFGLGYRVTVKSMLVYARSQTPPSWGEFGATSVEELGVVQAGGRYFYSIDDVWLRASPSGGDLILEPRYDSAGRIVGLREVYVVSLVMSYSVGRGLPAYYRIACHLESSALRSRESAFLARARRRG